MTTDAWDASDAYENYMGRWSRLVAVEFLRWLGLASGGRWADVGCGTGALGDAILDVADASVVTGVDASPEFVAHAAELAADDRAVFVVADAESLPFDDDAFDVAVSGLALNFVPDPVAATAEQRRVVKASGVVAAYVWDYDDGMQLLRRFWDAAIDINPSARALDERARFPSATPIGLRKTFESAGLRDIETDGIGVCGEYRDFDELWRPFLSGQGPAPGFVASLAPDEREAIRVRLRDALPIEADGSIELQARAWAVRGWS